MSTNEEEERGHQPDREGEALLIKGRVAELEREQKEAQKRDEDYKERQTLYSKRVAWFTGALVLTSLITNVIYLNMSRTARKAADAAKSAADTAVCALTSSSDSFQRTLKEMQAQTKAQQDSADAAKSASNTAAHQFELSERPWVNVSVRAIRHFTSSLSAGANLGVRLTMSNTGRSPAIGIHMEADMIPEPIRTINISTERDRLCNEASDYSTRNTTTTDTLFPGADFNRDFALNIAPDQVEIVSARLQGAILPVIIACVAYRPSFKSSIYETAVMYDVQMTEAERPGESFVIRVGEDVPVDHVILYPNFLMGSGHAK